MTTKRILTMAAVGALATVSTIAIGAATWLSASAAADPAGDVIRLHIPSSGVATFTYNGEPTQSVKPVKNSCVIDGIDKPATQNIMQLSATGPSAQATVGIANFGIGVKGSPSSGNGNPCAQTDLTENLKLKPGSSSTLSGRGFDKVRLDLEMTGNAIVLLTLGDGTTSQAFRLQTGTRISSAEQTELNLDPTPNDITTLSDDPTDACAAASSSNPNSQGSDNCLWTVDPDFTFNQITLTTELGGTVALEASADFGNSSDHDSLFYLAAAVPPVANPDPNASGDRIPVQKDMATPIDVLANDTPQAPALHIYDNSVSDPPHGSTSSDGLLVTYTPDPGFVGIDQFTYRAYDGTLPSNITNVFVRVCGDDLGVLPAGVTASFTRLTQATACKSNKISFDSTDTTVLFAPDGDGPADVHYRGFISFGPKNLNVITDPNSPDNGAIVLKLKYDKLGGTNYVPVPWCDNPQFVIVNGDKLVDTASVPSGDTWCIASEETFGQGTDQAVTTWQVYGVDDPRFV